MATFTVSTKVNCLIIKREVSTVSGGGGSSRPSEGKMWPRGSK